VARGRAAELHAHGAEGEIDLVVDRDHVLGIDPSLAGERGEGRPALVHERMRRCEQDPLAELVDLA
jgi:hypothetical protein